MTTARTAGPWFLLTPQCVGGPHGTNKTGGIAMCAMHLRSPAEQIANARAISKLPELIGALATILKYENDPDYASKMEAQCQPFGVSYRETMYREALKVLNEAEGI